MQSPASGSEQSVAQVLYRLGTKWTESNFAGKDLWALMNKKLNMSRQRALKDQPHTGCTSKGVASKTREGSYFLPIFGTSEAISALLDPVLESPVWERYWQRRTVWEANGWVLEHMMYEGLREMHLSSLKTRRLPGDPSAAFIYLGKVYGEDRLDFSEFLSGRWEAIGTSCNNADSGWIFGKKDLQWEQ